MISSAVPDWKSYLEGETYCSSRPFGSTTWTPPTIEASLSTANEMFFCLLMDRIQPLSVVRLFSARPAAASRVEAIVGGRAAAGL